MSVAGIRLPSGSAVWADAGSHHLSPLDRVTLRLPDGEISGWVFASPEQLLQAPERIEGVVVEVRPFEPDEASCADLPGADMPALGSPVRREQTTGVIVAIDAVQRTVTIRQGDGAEDVAPLSEVERSR